MEPYYRKIAVRLLPLLLICFTLAYLDRVNVSFAALRMSSDLHFNAEIYGFGAGVFFIGYFLLELPSNLILHRLGARWWLARIMITWGIISACTAMVKTKEMFYIVRFLLGLAEAGFFPGVVLYLTYWFPQAHRAKMLGLFLTAMPLSVIIGGPLAGLIMTNMNGLFGLTGWQWLFVAEGIPSVIVGTVLLIVLPNKPGEARWLTNEEKELVTRQLEREAEKNLSSGGRSSVLQALADWRVWILTAMYFCEAFAMNTILLWLPEVIKSFGEDSPMRIGLLTGLAWAFAVVAMLIVGWHSDKRQERFVHGWVSATMAGVGFALCATASTEWLGLVGAGLAASGLMSFVICCWTVPTFFLSGRAAATGIAVINSIANLAGFIGPYMVGIFTKATHDPRHSLLMVAASAFMAGILIMVSRRFVVRPAMQTA